MDHRKRLANVVDVRLEAWNTTKAAANNHAVDTPISRRVDEGRNIQQRIVPRGDGLSYFWAHAHALVLNGRVFLVQNFQHRDCGAKSMPRKVCCLGALKQ